jgi:hypothetical protein
MSRLANAPSYTDDGILRVQCIQWDTICQTSDGIDVFNQSKSVSDFNRRIQSWEPDGLESMRYPTGEDILDAYCRTILTDRSFDWETRATPGEIEKHREEFLIWSGRKQIQQELPKPSEQQPVTEKISIFDDLRHRLFGWTMATTGKGYLALVPVLSEIGDVVCVLPSLGVPLVLREIPTNESSMKQYMLIGPSYVHGIMDGEVIRWVEQGELNEETIGISHESSD